MLEATARSTLDVPDTGARTGARRLQKLPRRSSIAHAENEVHARPERSRVWTHRTAGRIRGEVQSDESPITRSTHRQRLANAADEPGTSCDRRRRRRAVLLDRRPQVHVADRHESEPPRRRPAEQPEPSSTSDSTTWRSAPRSSRRATATSHVTRRRSFDRGATAARSMRSARCTCRPRRMNVDFGGRADIEVRARSRRRLGRSSPACRTSRCSHRSPCRVAATTPTGCDVRRQVHRRGHDRSSPRGCGSATSIPSTARATRAVHG